MSVHPALQILLTGSTRLFVKFSVVSSLCSALKFWYISYKGFNIHGSTPARPISKIICSWISESKALLTSCAVRAMLSPLFLASYKAKTRAERAWAQPRLGWKPNWWSVTVHFDHSSSTISASNNLQKTVATVIGWNDKHWQSAFPFQVQVFVFLLKKNQAQYSG